MTEKQHKSPEHTADTNELFERTSLVLGSNVLRMFTLLTVAGNRHDSQKRYGPTKVRSSIIAAQGESPSWKPAQTVINNHLDSLISAKLIRQSRQKDETYTYGHALDLNTTKDGIAMGVPEAAALILLEDKHPHTSLPFIMGENTGCALRLDIYNHLIHQRHPSTKSDIISGFNDDDQGRASKMVEALRDLNILQTSNRFNPAEGRVSITQPMPLHSLGQTDQLYNPSTQADQLAIALHQTAASLYEFGINALSGQGFLDALNATQPNIDTRSAATTKTLQELYEQAHFLDFTPHLNSVVRLSIDPTVKEPIQDLLHTLHLCRTSEGFRKHLRSAASQHILPNIDLVNRVLVKAKISSKRPNTRSRWLTAIQAAVPEGGMSTRDVYEAIDMQPRMAYSKFAEMVRTFGEEGKLQFKRGRFAKAHNYPIGWITLNIASSDTESTGEE